jgi:hypothetical protein
MTMRGDYTSSQKEEEQAASVSKEEQDELQSTLYSKCRDVGWNNVRAVWLGDEENGSVALTGMDRWMQYAEKGLCWFLWAFSGLFPDVH